MRPSPRPRAGAALALAVLGLLALGGRPAAAQMLHLDPMPFFTPADSTSRLALVLDFSHAADSRWDWTTERLLMTIVLPAGDDATFFLRLPHLTFDTGETPVRSRWPWVVGEGAEPGWPDEKRLSGFGKIEVGVTGPMVLPLVRGVDYGLALGLPSSSDRLYPVSSQSIPFRIEARKPLVLGGGWQAGLEAGYLMHGDSGRDLLDPAAFPSGYRFGATCAFYGRPGSRWELFWNLRNENDRASQVVGLQGWLPWTADGAVGLRFEHELAGTLDRYAEWRATLSWRLDSPGRRQGREKAREVVD
ncbi:hypothetical protein KDM41_01675 [bacterium]|nr:hypothetical protein [bacterium]